MDVSNEQTHGAVAASTPAPSGASAAQNVTWYLAKIKELIPAEVTAAFLAINSAVPIDDRYIIWIYVFFGALLALCLLYMIVQSSSLVRALFVTFIAFPVWAINISMARFDWLVDKTWLPACVLFLVTAMSPLIVLIDPPTQPHTELNPPLH